MPSVFSIAESLNVPVDPALKAIAGYLAGANRKKHLKNFG
jgi:hypothetical protein